jgi:hypothetical protein
LTTEQRIQEFRSASTVGNSALPLVSGISGRANVFSSFGGYVVCTGTVLARWYQHDSRQHHVPPELETRPSRHAVTDRVAQTTRSTRRGPNRETRRAPCVRRAFQQSALRFGLAVAVPCGEHLWLRRPKRRAESERARTREWARVPSHHVRLPRVRAACFGCFRFSAGLNVSLVELDGH